MRCERGRCQGEAVQSVWAPQDRDEARQMAVCDKHYRILAKLPKAPKPHLAPKGKACVRCKVKRAEFLYGVEPARPVCVACYNELTKPLVASRPMAGWPHKSGEGSLS